MTKMAVFVIVWLVLAALSFFVFDNDIAGWASLVISNVYVVGFRLHPDQEPKE